MPENFSFSLSCLKNSFDKLRYSFEVQQVMQPSYVSQLLTSTMTPLTPATYPSTPLDKVRDISSPLGSILKKLQDQSGAQDTSGSPSNQLTLNIGELIRCFHHQQTAIEALSQTPSPTRHCFLGSICQSLLTTSTMPNTKTLIANQSNLSMMGLATPWLPS
jgi:hypothetical protein